MMSRRLFLRHCCRLCVGAAVIGSLGLGFGGHALAATAEQQRDFFRAVQMDDATTVRRLLSAVDPNIVNPAGGEPALVLAAREGSMNVLKVLLADPRTQVDAQAINGNTALMMAAYKGNQPAVEALLARGAAVNRPGWTALHYAAASGSNAIAGLLLEHGARVDAVAPSDKGAYTPLMMAAREGHEDSALFLLDHGADPLLRNSEGLSAAQIAERADHKSISSAIQARLKATR
jgi:ankyrin repeat protein